MARSTILMETEELVLTTPSLLCSLISIWERASILPACALILIPRGASMLKDRVGDSSLKAGVGNLRSSTFSYVPLFLKNK